MKTVFIYALKDPITGLVRYVGKAENPKKRMELHYFQAKKQRNHRACWIRSLVHQGLKPVLQILTEVEEPKWVFWEKEYIKLYKEIGFDLTNSSDGGEGNSFPGDKNPFFGRKHSKVSNEKNRMSHIGKRHSPAALEKMSGENNHNFGKDFSGEKHPGFGIKRSEGARANMKIAQIKRRQQEKLAQGI